MPCFRPLKGYRSKERTENGKRRIVFNPKEAYYDLKIDIPCGQCAGCRDMKRKEWAVRILHESSLHEHNSFITLTYNEKHLPKDGSVHLEDFQNFMKNLRMKETRLARKASRYSGNLIKPRKIKYFMCMEYGDNGRPHYHACLFGYDFSDKVKFSKVGDNQYYLSRELENIWKKGFCLIGNVEIGSAMYCAQYIQKKITGKMKEEYYEGREPEKATQSNGIALGWFQKFNSDLTNGDFIILGGRKYKVPKYYSNLLENLDKEIHMNILAHRQVNVKKHAKELTHERLKVKEKIKLKNIERYKNEANDMFNL